MISAIKAKELSDLANMLDEVISDIGDSISYCARNKKYSITFVNASASILAVKCIKGNQHIMCKIKDKDNYYLLSEMKLIRNLEKVDICKVLDALINEGFKCMQYTLNLVVDYTDSNDEPRRLIESIKYHKIS